MSLGDQDARGGQRPLSRATCPLLWRRMRSLRRASKLKQREVAERIPMSPGNLSRIENGDYGPPSNE